MAERVHIDEKSDDLHIVSIGKLYEGPWEKKYWSSSRGKDRHPYPVGYVALRMYNGNTYEMAILEGLKGPEFTISSTDGQSCSGQTPDIVWEGFQKKSCVRIKFWRGKRFSCKIDGAELFGFKNPLVKRLLRELKASVSQIAEQRLPSSCFGNGQSEAKCEHHTPGTVCSAETCEYTDLLVNSVKTQGKEKITKKRKEVYVKPVSGAKSKRGRPQDLTQGGDRPHCRQSCEGTHGKGIPLCSSNLNENNTGMETMTFNGNSRSHLSSAEDGLQVDYSISCERLRKDKCVAVQEVNNSIGSKDFVSIEDGINLLKDHESLDVSIFTLTPGFTSMKTLDEKGDSPVEKDSQMLDDVNLYAPDTLDPALDGTCNPEDIPKASIITINEKLNAAQNLVSEKSITESQSKDETVIAGGGDNSEKSDLDRVGQEIAKSMMTLLLPRALPLLKTFSRKKKTSLNCGKKDLHGMSQEESKGTSQCLEDEPPAKPSEQIQLQELNHEVQIPDEHFIENPRFEQNENVLFPSTDSLLVPGLEDSTTVAPDSFENDRCEVMKCSQAGQVQEAIRVDKNTSGIDLCTHEGNQVCPNVQPSEEVCRTGKTISKTNTNHDVDLVLEKRPQRGGKFMKSYDVGNLSPSRKDMCIHPDAPFYDPKLTDDKISLCHTEGTVTTVDARSTSAVHLDHAAQTRISGVTGGISDGNASFTSICRDPKGDRIVETCSPTNVSPTNSEIDKMKPGKQIHGFQMERNPTWSNSTSCVMATVAPHQDDVLSPSYKFTADVCEASVNCEGQSHASGYTALYEIQGQHEVDSLISILQDQRISNRDKTESMLIDEEAKNEPCINKSTTMVQNVELANKFELVGCYEHPTPISMVILRTKGNEAFICVLCGYLMEKDRTLFVYKASIKGERRGSPSFVGHTRVISPILRNASGGQILLDSASLQFTPDGNYLVLLNNIRAPYCREGSLTCQCSACTPDCFENNAVNVVQVKFGYLQLVCKLKTANDICCILVCEPNYLVAAEESGRMNLWIMNSTWSSPTEKSCLPTSDCMPNHIVEMKRMPNFPALVVGHSAFGDFCLWDLTRRILLSTFSAPETSFLPFLPINIYRCPSQGFTITGACRKKQVEAIMEETQRWSSETDNHAALPVKEDDLSLVLLVSSAFNVDHNDEHPYKGSGVSPVGCWSLALLAKNKLISEIALDPSATVAGASAGYGIIGTCDGSLYIWELSTGTRVGYLNHCRGATVSCLASDDSNSGVFAVAVDGSLLQVYAPGT